MDSNYQVIKVDSKGCIKIPSSFIDGSVKKVCLVHRNEEIDIYLEDELEIIDETLSENYINHNITRDERKDIVRFFFSNAVTVEHKEDGTVKIPFDIHTKEFYLVPKEAKVKKCTLVPKKEI